MPYKNFIAEILAAHADKILNESAPGLDYKQLYPQTDELPDLLNLADHVKAALEPVQPSASFTDRLQQDLMTAYQNQQTDSQQSATSVIWPVIVSAFIALAGLYYIKKRQSQFQP